MGSYQVQSGDNLWKIVKDAFKLTDSNKINEKVKEIAELNNIKNMNSIFIGQKLNLGQTENNQNTLPETATRDFTLGGTIPDEGIVKHPETPKAQTADAQTAQNEKSRSAAQPEASDARVPNEGIVRHPAVPEQPKPENNTIKSETQPQQKTAAQTQQTTAQNNTDEIPFMTPMAFLEDAMKGASKDEADIQVPLREGITEPTEDPVPRIKSKGLPDFLKVNPDPILKPGKISIERYAEIPVTTPFTGSADDINRHLKGVLKGQGEKFLEMQEKYGINAAFLAGIVMNESANGTSDLAVKKNNVGGVRYPGSYKFKEYDDVGDCIEHMAKFLSNSYIKKGKTTIGTIAAKYCPVSDETDKDNLNQYWPRNVGSKMAKIDPKILA